ncbi:MAG: hypothetical protein Q8Q42_02115 [Nanoarchaeota archaeon]|nr:hypothetical protein [Nanoarchaeota archaeon]
MKIPDDMLVELVKEVAGADTLKVLEILKNKKNVSEFKIAEKLGISVNQVRNIIYRMQEHNLVTFTRKKDSDKGWYIYYWTFDMPRAIMLIADMKNKSIGDAKENLLHVEDTRVYVCKNCRLKFPEMDALEMQFLCETCGEIMLEEDSAKRKKDLSKRLKKDEEDLKVANEILMSHREMIAKSAEKQMIKEKAEKDIKRKTARELAKKTAKTTKKVVSKPKKKIKKTVKKPPVKKKPIKTTKKTSKKSAKKTVKKRILRRVFNH